MSNIKLFESKQIRTVWNEADEKWYFVVADIIQVLKDKRGEHSVTKPRNEKVASELTEDDLSFTHQSNTIFLNRASTLRSLQFRLRNA